MGYYSSNIKLTIILILSIVGILVSSTSSFSSSISLTHEEQQWLSQHKTIRVSGPQAFPPFQFFNEEDEYVGMAADYLQYIAAQLGISVEYLPKTSWKKVLELIQHKEIDVLSCTAFTEERSKYLLFSDPHITFPLVIISRKDGPEIKKMQDIEGMRIALVKKVSTETSLNKSQITFIPYYIPSPKDALEAVSLGHADIAIENLAAASYIIEKQGYTNLKIAASTDFDDYALAIAIRKDWPLFQSIVNKSLATISEQQHREIRQRWFSVRYEHGITLIDVLKWIAFSLLISSVVIGTIILWNRRLAKEIEERKKVEVQLRESERKLSTLIDNLPGMAYRCSNEKKWSMEFISDGCLDVTGFLPSEISKNSSIQYGDIIYPDDRQHVWERAQEGVEHNKLFEIEYRIITKSGNIKWVWERGGKVADIQTRDIYLEGFIADITKQKISIDNLQKFQKMEAIGALAGGIAHDFNNILGAIIGYTEMARDDSPKGSSVVRDLDKVLEASDRAAGLVKQILTFSRQDETEYVPVQPADIVKKSIEMLRPTIPTTIEITQNIAPETGLIFADPTQIHQILINLCTNAFHAMEETGGKLDISVKEIDLSSEDLTREPHIAGGTFIQLSVSDSGAGIPLKVRDKIFDPFFTTKEVGKGTGMGLSIIHGIVKSYGGFITLYSELGQGTVFHVFLPIITKEMLPDEKAIEAIKHLPVGREKILFIDDEDILADLGKDMLKRLGYYVTVRKSSLEALETFQNQPDQFDLVITDQAMPGMTGIDLARRMLQIRPNIPIILCTGYSSIVSEEKAKSIGIREFALKPLTKKNAAELIRRVLDDNQK